jgi:hypothetical protein
MVHEEMWTLMMMAAQFDLGLAQDLAVQRVQPKELDWQR